MNYDWRDFFLIPVPNSEFNLLIHLRHAHVWKSQLRPQCLGQRVSRTWFAMDEKGVIWPFLYLSGPL
jgi:hypothetical protein